jgi:2-polyprenyl-6-methoxyphenol hydroxylase-like FAD-dependent oxidoreductase
VSESVVVIGAGIAGLCTALALGPTGRTITLLERDGAPPSGDPDEAFRDWRRQGVGHLRQSHAFLARLRTLIKADHPTLLDELLALGVRELPFEGMLSEMQRETYAPLASDAELTIITSRRTTLELVMRRYVETLPNVTIRSGAFVRRLLTAKATDGVIDVLGVATDQEELRADIVIDASGKIGSTIDQLIAEGGAVHEESESAGILYFTRHYRLKPGMSEPPRIGNPPPNGDLGFLKFGVFPGDNGCFSITMCTPEIEYEMRKAIVDPDIFHAMTLMLPGLRVWTDEERAEPTSKVFGMGDLHSRWRDMAVGETPAARGYFALGDTLIRTNPLYGRGCSFAAVSAYLLRDVLAGDADPTARALAYPKRIRTELRPYYTTMRAQDRGAIKRAKQALTPGYKQSRRAKLLQSFLEDGVAVAMRYDVGLLRQAMRGFHMLEHPNKWLGRPQNMARILYFWSRGKKRNARAYPPKPGPEREAMMRKLGLDFQADIALAAQEKQAA